MKSRYFSSIFQHVDACYIFGYGSETLAGDPTLDLRLAPVKIISQESCLHELGPWNAPEIDSGLFCAVGENPGVDSCPVNQFLEMMNSFYRFSLTKTVRKRIRSFDVIDLLLLFSINLG